MGQILAANFHIDTVDQETELGIICAFRTGSWAAISIKNLLPLRVYSVTLRAVQYWTYRILFARRAARSTPMFTNCLVPVFHCFTTGTCQLVTKILALCAVQTDLFIWLKYNRSTSIYAYSMYVSYLLHVLGNRLSWCFRIHHNWQLANRKCESVQWVATLQTKKA